MIYAWDLSIYSFPREELLATFGDYTTVLEVKQSLAKHFEGTPPMERINLFQREDNKLTALGNNEKIIAVKDTGRVYFAIKPETSPQEKSKHGAE
jgi:hypothetical protein